MALVTPLLGLLKPVAGLQLNVALGIDPGTIFIDCPKHISFDVIGGIANSFTVIVTLDVVVHPLSVCDAVIT